VVSAVAFVLPLLNCAESRHTVDEQYFLIATNVKLPYRQQALAGSTVQPSRMSHVQGPLEEFDPAR
jgi:hypothetical protein